MQSYNKLELLLIIIIYISLNGTQLFKVLLFSSILTQVVRITIIIITIIYIASLTSISILLSLIPNMQN